MSNDEINLVPDLPKPISSAQAIAPLGAAVLVGVLAAATRHEVGNKVHETDFPAYPLFGVAIIVLSSWLLWIGVAWDRMPKWVHAMCRPPVSLTPLFLGAVFLVAGGYVLFSGLAAHFSP